MCCDARPHRQFGYLCHRWGELYRDERCAPRGGGRLCGMLISACLYTGARAHRTPTVLPSPCVSRDAWGFGTGLSRVDSVLTRARNPAGCFVMLYRWKREIALLRSQLDDQTALAASWEARHDAMGVGLRRFGAVAKAGIGGLRKELGVLKSAATPGNGGSLPTLFPPFSGDHFSRFRRRFTTPHAPCDMLYLAPVLYWMLTGACNLTVRPIHVLNRTAMGGCYGWLLLVVAMGGCHGWMLTGACNLTVRPIHVLRRGCCCAAARQRAGRDRAADRRGRRGPD